MDEKKEPYKKYNRYIHRDDGRCMLIIAAQGLVKDIEDLSAGTKDNFTIIIWAKPICLHTPLEACCFLRRIQRYKGSIYSNSKMKNTLFKIIGGIKNIATLKRLMMIWKFGN